MTILCQKMVWLLAPTLGLTLNCAASAQSSPQALDPEEASMRLDRLSAELRDRSSVVRVQALEAIEASAGILADRVDGILLDALDDPSPLVSETALRALLNRDDERLLSTLERHLVTHPGATRDLVKVRLATYKHDTSALRELVVGGDALVQERAFESLASEDSENAVGLLRKEFRDPASLHRLQTLELFARSPYTSAAATLAPMLDLASSDADPLVRDRAKQLLGEKSALAHDGDST